MNKKILIIIFIIVMFCSVVCGKYLFLSKDNKKDMSDSVYVIFNETLCYNDLSYIECNLNVEAIELDKQIGITNNGKQIYSIKNTDLNDFICLREEGTEKIFQNANKIPLSDIRELNLYKMIVSEDNSIEDTAEITDVEIIEKVLNQIQDENVVNDEVVGAKFRDLTFYSKSYEGFCYKYTYIVDEYEDEYLYDPYQGIAWKFTEKVFDIE